MPRNAQILKVSFNEFYKFLHLCNPPSYRNNHGYDFSHRVLVLPVTEVHLQGPVQDVPPV